MQKFLWVIIVLLIVTLSGCDSKRSSDQESTPLQNNIIIDDAVVLDDDTELMDMYKKYNQGLLKDFDIDFRVITTLSDEDIDIFANKMFTKLQKGSRSKSGKALLLVINTTQDKIRLEVSQALEPIYTDAFISYIERKGFVPYLRDMKIADGVYMATELVYDRATQAKAGKEFMLPMASKSVGGGAKTKAYIGKVDPEAKKGVQVFANSSDAPMDVMQRYIAVLKSHNKNPNLDIYSQATQKFFQNWTVTDINQNNEVNNVSKCFAKYETLYDFKHNHAVLAVLPYDKYRACSPYFFKIEDGQWKLDIATMAQVLRFNAQMAFHFDKKQRLEKEGKYYAYAFDGYWLDQNGYPHRYTKKNDSWSKYRWKYSCNGYFHPGDTKDDMRCWIRVVSPGGPANVRLGLEGGEKIYGFVDGQTKKTDVTMSELIEYLNSVSKGEVAKIIIEHYYLNGKESYDFDAILNPNVKVDYEIREGIAP